MAFGVIEITFWFESVLYKAYALLENAFLFRVKGFKVLGSSMAFVIKAASLLAAIIGAIAFPLFVFDITTISAFIWFEAATIAFAYDWLLKEFKFSSVIVKTLFAP